MLEALQAGGLADAGDQFSLQEIGRGRHFRRVELCGEASKPMDVAGRSFGEVRLAGLPGRASRFPRGPDASGSAPLPRIRPKLAVLTGMQCEYGLYRGAQLFARNRLVEHACDAHGIRPLGWS